MTNKLMYIANNDSQNYPFCRLHEVVESLETQLNEPTKQNSTKVPKVVKQTSKKTLF